MIDDVNVIRFARVSDGANDHIYSLNGSVYVHKNGSIMFTCPEPFEIDFGKKAPPFLPGTTISVNTQDIDGQYSSDIFMASVTGRKTRAYSYSVTLSPGTPDEISDDPQVIVDPEQAN